MLVLFVMLLDEFFVFIIVFVFLKCYCFIFEIKFIVGIKIIKFRLEWKDLFYVSDDRNLN